MDKDQITTELLTWLKDAAEKGGSFVEREAPLLANEIVAWHFWASVFLALVFVVFGLLLIGIGAALFYFSLKINDPENGVAGAMFGLIVTLAGVVLLFVGGLVNGYEAVKAAVAPRVVIVEYLRGTTP